eukprot:927660-Pelagomonas_calceolata.AAC.1
MVGDRQKSRPCTCMPTGIRGSQSIYGGGIGPSAALQGVRTHGLCMPEFAWQGMHASVGP